MSGDVTIPADVAKRYAAALRSHAVMPEGLSSVALADLLDPKPPTLREAVAQALKDLSGDGRGLRPGTIHHDRADAVLAVVRERIDLLDVDDRTLTGSINDDTRHAFDCGIRAHRRATLALFDEGGAS